MERLAADLVGEHARSAVVEKDDVQLLRPVAFRHPGPQRGVRVHALTGRRPRQQLQEHLEVGERREQLLDSEDRDEHRRKRRAHAPVPLRLDDANRPRFGNAEVRPADTDLRAEEPLAQVEPRDLRQVCAASSDARPGAIVRANRSRISAAVPVDSRDEDVRRPVAVELQDQLGEVRLDRVDALLRECLVQADLVGRQRLHLDDLARAMSPRDLGHDGVRLCCVTCPVHPAAGCLHRRLELDEVAVEVREHVLP